VILKIFTTVIAFILANSASAQKQLTLVEYNIQIKKNLSFTIKIPEGYGISVAARGLERPRFFAQAPDGRIFITDMHDRGDNEKGRVLVLEDWNDTARQFQKITTVLEGLHNPNQVAFYSANGRHYMYVAETGKLSYYQYTPLSNQLSSPTVIASFPDYGLSYKYGGWHLTRSIDFHNNKIYVSVGSSCDACIETEEVRASIIEMNLDGSNQRIYARGLRNAVGIKWIGDELWVTNMGRDNRGPDKPEDLLHTVQADGYYGWPYYFQYHKKILADEAFKDSVKPAFVKRPPIAKWAFEAHTAPLGLAYITGFTDTVFNNSFLVALHGSTSVWRQRGNAVVQVLPNGSYREIVTGFLQGKTESKRFGRPCDVFQWNNNSFFISDDKNGIIYYVWKEN
jgi:glucose/arabinose dehydrogenase